ncbi:MAG: hypothetical protein PHT58_07875 [Eubacteriales bacterium]|nr:hypothetical protein [Eubacteriales bacterium]
MNYLHKNCKLAIAVLAAFCIAMLAYVIIALRSQCTSEDIALYCVKIPFLMVMLFGSIYTYFRQKSFHTLVLCTLLAMFPLFYSAVTSANNLVSWFSRLGDPQMRTLESLMNVAVRVFWLCFSIGVVCTVITSMLGFSKATVALSVTTCAFALLTIASILTNLGNAPSTAKLIVQCEYMVEFVIFSVATLACVAQFYVGDHDSTPIKRAYAYDELGFEKDE